MNEAPLTAADVSAVVGNRGYDGMMGGPFAWIFGLIFLAAMFNGNGFGGFGGGYRGGSDVLTTAESCTMNSFNELKSQVGRMNDMMFQDQTALSNAICTLGFQSEQQTNTLSAQIAAGLCDLKQLVVEQNSLTRDLIQTNKIEALQEKVASLEADARLANVVRYPNQYVYATGNPFFNCNNGCNSFPF